MLLRTIRSCTLAVFALSVPFVALAQRGGGPGGGGPGGGGPGGGPGGGAPSGMGGGSRGSAGAGPMGSGAPGPGMGSSGGMGNRGQSSVSGPRRSMTMGPPGRWWDDKRISHNLNLRADQQKKMDDIFDANRQGLTQLYSNLQQQQGKLSSMSKADLEDETKLFAAIDRVTQARAELQKASTNVMLQIRKELDASQVAALDREAAASR